MTLSDMAAFVCAKVRQQDATAVTRCKEFLRQRYEMLYADQLWRASLYLHEFSIPALERDYDPNITTTGEEGMYFFPESVDRVLAVRYSEDQVDVIDELQLYRGTLDQYEEEEGAPLKFSILSPALFWVASPDQDSMILQATRSSDEDANISVTARWIDGMGNPHTRTQSGGMGFPDDNENGIQLLESVTHDAMTGALVLEFDEGDTGSFIDVGRSLAGSTGMVPRQRIRVYPKPGNGADRRSMRALVKRKVVCLIGDNESPLLAGIENSLMAFAQSDMLQRARQYGKAQIVQQEALALFDQFKRLEVVQQANRQQITPEVSEPSGMIGWQRSKGFV